MCEGEQQQVTLTRLPSTCQQLKPRKGKMITVFSTRPGLPRTSLQNIKGKAVYFICGTRVAVLKDYNLSRHYMTKNEKEIETLSQNRSKGSRFSMESSLKECEWTLLQ